MSEQAVELDRLSHVPPPLAESMEMWSRALDAAQPSVVRDVLRNGAADLYRSNRVGRFDCLTEIGDFLQRHAEINEIDDEEAQQIFAEGRSRADAASAKPAPTINGHAHEIVSSAPEPPLPEEWKAPSYIDVAAWQGVQPTEREWAVPDRVPLRNVTLFSGEGGVGKSLIALHCSTAVVAHCDWLGKVPQPGPALVVCCEDDEAELHRRMARIAQHCNTSFAELAKDMHIISLAGKDAMMAVPAKSGLMQPTALLKWVHDAARDIRPRIMVIDNSADVFGGNENDRAQVRQFITMLREVAIDGNTGLILTSPPSNRGVDTGSGLSGSTAWHASVRSRLYLKRAVTDRDEEPDPDLRVLEVMKSNYGPVGEAITLRWKDGLFLPAGGTSGIDKLAAQQHQDEVFLTLLKQFYSQGRNVSGTPQAPTYAPALFCKEELAKGIRKAELADAMRRLFAAHRIHVEQYGKPSRPYSRLAIAPPS